MLLKKHNLFLLLLSIFLPLIFYFLQQWHIIHIICLVGIYIMLCLGLNFVIGWTGLLDLGFIAFYAIAAYISAILSINGFSFWIILPLSCFCCIIFRILLGLPVLRLRGDYFAIVTLGFGEIVRIVLNNWDRFSNGPKGLPRYGEIISPIKIFNFTLFSDIHFYYLILFFVLIEIIITERIAYSQTGRAMFSIKEDETASSLMGINTNYIKLLSLILSAFFAGIAGCIYTHWIGFVSPESFTFWESVLLVTMIVLGGMGNIRGVILGVILIIGIPELLRDVLGPQFALYRMLIFGLAMIIMVIFKPTGILPVKRQIFQLKEEE